MPRRCSPSFTTFPLDSSLVNQDKPPSSEPPNQHRIWDIFPICNAPFILPGVFFPSQLPSPSLVQWGPQCRPLVWLARSLSTSKLLREISRRCSFFVSTLSFLVTQVFSPASSFLLHESSSFFRTISRHGLKRPTQRLLQTKPAHLPPLA